VRESPNDDEMLRMYALIQGTFSEGIKEFTNGGFTMPIGWKVSHA
jgi:hypothetical protein